MKKLLFIILTLFSLQSFAQDTTYVKVRGIPGVYNLSLNGGGDSIIFYVAGVRNALSVGTVVDLTPFLRKSDTADMLLPYATKQKLKADSTTLAADIANKVDKITGKGLSTEDYTTSEKSKLSGIASGAEVNVNADWNASSGDAQILNKPTLFSGSYNDLSDKPTIPDVSGKVDKTTTINGHALSSNVTVSKSDIGLGNVDNTSDVSKPISTATQNALDLKADDNNVVHLTGSESIAGNKTFTNQVFLNSFSGNVQMDGSGISVSRSQFSNGNSLSGGAYVFFGDVLSFKTGNLAKEIFRATTDGFKLTTTGDAAGNFVTINGSGLLKNRTASEALSDMGGLSSTTAASTYATKTDLGKKLDTSFRQNLYAESPIEFKNDNTIGMVDHFDTSITYNDGIDTTVIDQYGLQFTRNPAYIKNRTPGANTNIASDQITFANHDNSTIYGYIDGDGEYFNNNIYVGEERVALLSDLSTLVTTNTNQTISGTKTFTSNIIYNNGTNTSYIDQYGLHFDRGVSYLANTATDGTLRLDADNISLYNDVDSLFLTSNQDGTIITHEVIIPDSLNVGNSNTPNSALTTTSFASAYRYVNANTTATVDDYTLDGYGTVTITLPDATTMKGRTYVVLNSGSGTVTIATTASQTFDNIDSAPTSVAMTTKGGYTVQSTGSNWVVINKF